MGSSKLRTIAELAFLTSYKAAYGTTHKLIQKRRDNLKLGEFGDNVASLGGMVVGYSVSLPKYLASYLVANRIHEIMFKTNLSYGAYELFTLLFLGEFIQPILGAIKAKDRSKPDVKKMEEELLQHS